MTEPDAVAKKKQTDPKKLAAELAETGRAFHARGWALGTSGNYSAVLKDKPLRLLIPPTAAPHRAKYSRARQSPENVFC